MNVTSALGWILGSQTPSGAIDVIAIRKHDGTVNCSPFHVKLPISRTKGSQNIVKLTINGKDVALSMKLGSAGEAFFVERTKQSDFKQSQGLQNNSQHNQKEQQQIQPEIQNQTPISIEATGTPSGIRRVQSESDLKTSKNPIESALPQNATPDSTSISQAEVIPPAENLEEYDRPTSKRRAFTFAGDDFDKSEFQSPGDKEELESDTNLKLTEENLILASTSSFLPTQNSPESRIRSPSRTDEWTWAWGTLPIQASDPSIADLQSLTDLALREKFGHSSKSPDTREYLLSPSADGKGPSILPSQPMTPTQSIDQDLEFRQVPSEEKKYHNKRLLSGASSHSPADVDLAPPEPKCPQHLPPVGSVDISPTPLSDDYRHTGASPTPESREMHGSSEVDREIPRSTNISARAANIASALGSDRILSLCAHILSSEVHSPRTESDLLRVLEENVVSPAEFSSRPSDILNNPNLVVVVKNILIPWKLVHAHLTQSVPKSSTMFEQEELPVLVEKKLWWAGRTVTNWGLWNLQGAKPSDGENQIISFSSVSRSVSARSMSNSDLKAESRRDSGGNPDEEDFDHFECMSEGSNNNCPSWGQGLDDMDTPGAHLWSKEALNWNSADDLQRLLNEYTRAESVPDLLKPYVPYSNIWPTIEVDDASVSSNSTQHNMEKVDAQHFHQIDTTQSRAIPGSRSHDTGLSLITTESKKIIQDPPKETEQVSSISPHLVSDVKIPTITSSTAPVAEALEEEENVTDFISLEDISPDDILPGPARSNYDGSDTESFYSLNLDDDASSHSEQKDAPKNPERKYRYRKTIVPTQEQIKRMELVDGKNEITFEIEGNKVTAHIFVWPEDAKIVVADIEGALFVSGSNAGALGLMMSLWGSSSARKETHEGLAQLFDSIAANGYRFLYITTKPDTSQKEQLLKSSAKGSARYVGLPAGPVFLPPNALIQSFGSERTDLFKAAALRGVRSLFPPQHNPYHAAFGANARDVRAFDRCDIPLGRTFLVNEKGEVTTMTTVTVKRTFTEVNSLLHQLFPAFTDSFSRLKSNQLAKIAPPVTEDTYSDFNFWRLPPPPPPPPLPTRKK